VDFHTSFLEAKIFGYHDGGKHAVDPSVSARIIIIGTTSFLNDVVIAVESFIKAMLTDLDLRSRVNQRLPRVLTTFPVEA